MLNLDALTAARVAETPFRFMTAREVIDAGALRAISRDFPEISQAGVFPLSELSYGAAFAQLIEAIRSRELEMLLEAKFGLDLSDKPLMITARGRCQRRDGRIHTDSKDKVLTCLLYLNPGDWSAQGGRLRLYGDHGDADSVVAEVPPDGGAFVAFERSDRSWHGHAPFEGPRRSVMFNWLKSRTALGVNVGRHRLSAAVKRLGLSDAR